MSGISDDQKKYLNDVLGVESIVRPEGVEADDVEVLDSAWEITGADSPALYFVYVGPESDELDDILCKMIAATKIGETRLARLREIENLNDYFAELEADLQSSYAGMGVVLGEASKNLIAKETSSETKPGEWFDSIGVKWMYTYDLTLMSPSSGEDVRKHKKEAWSHLQTVMRELSR